MKSKAINALDYIGIVTLSKQRGNTKTVLAKTHNAGYYSLFNFLSDCLVGDFKTAQYGVPAKIMLVNVTEGVTNEVYEPISGFIYCRTAPEKLYDMRASKVRYSFVIPRDIIENGNFYKLGIGLYTQAATNVDEFSAFCTLDDISSADIATTSVLVLDWELTIANQDGSRNTEVEI